MPAIDHRSASTGLVSFIDSGCTSLAFPLLRSLCCCLGFCLHDYLPRPYAPRNTCLCVSGCHFGGACLGTIVCSAVEWVPACRAWVAWATASWSACHSGVCTCCLPASWPAGSAAYHNMYMCSAWQTAASLHVPCLGPASALYLHCVSGSWVGFGFTAWVQVSAASATALCTPGSLCLPLLAMPACLQVFCLPSAAWFACPACCLDYPAACCHMPGLPASFPLILSFAYLCPSWFSGWINLWFLSLLTFLYGSAAGFASLTFLIYICCMLLPPLGFCCSNHMPAHYSLWFSGFCTQFSAACRSASGQLLMVLPRYAQHCLSLPALSGWRIHNNNLPAACCLLLWVACLPAWDSAPCLLPLGLHCLVSSFLGSCLQFLVLLWTESLLTDSSWMVLDLGSGSGCKGCCACPMALCLPAAFLPAIPSYPYLHAACLPFCLLPLLGACPAPCRSYTDMPAISYTHLDFLVLPLVLIHILPYGMNNTFIS